MDGAVLAGGGGLACTLLVALATAAVLLVLVVWLFRRRRTPASAVATGPLAPLAGVANPSERRDALLERIEPALGYLGALLEVVKGSRDDLRLKGHLRGMTANLEIGSDGRFAVIEVVGSLPAAQITLRSHGRHEDPEDQLRWLDAYELEALVAQMTDARLSAIRIGPDRLVAESVAQFHALGDYQEATVMGQTLAALENAIGIWQDRVEPEPERESEPVPQPAAAPSAPVDPIKAALSWDYEACDDVNAALSAGAARLFSAVEDLLTKGKLILPDPDDWGDAELRGRIDDVPLRLILDNEGTWKIEGKIAPVEGSLYVRYNTELPAVAADADDDWADEDVVRVFLAKGLYVEAGPEVVEMYMHFAERMSDHQIDRLRDEMASLPVDFVWLQGDELEMGGSGTVQQMEDPVATLRQILVFAGWLGSDIPGSAAEAGSFSQVQCAYCSARYFYGVRRGACPNCGAPPGA